MMRLLGLLFIISLPLYINAQKFDIRWGERQNIKGLTSGNYRYLGYMDDHYFFVEKPETKHQLKVYNDAHDLVLDQKVELDNKSIPFQIHGAGVTRSKFFLYGHQYWRKYNEWIINIVEYKEGKIGKPKEIYFDEFEISKKRVESQFKGIQFRMETLRSDLIFSPDSSKVAFVNIFEAENFKDKDVVAVAVFDENLNQLWKAQFYYKFGKNRYDHLMKVLSNAGDIYLLGTRFKEKDERKKKNVNDNNLPRFEYVVQNINEEGIIEKVVDIGDKIAPDQAFIFVSPTIENIFTITGFYQDDAYKNRTKGVYTLSGTSELDNFTIKTHSFPEDVLEKVSRKRELKKDKGLRSNFIINAVIQYEDGGMGLIAEDYRVNSYMVPNTAFNNGFNNTTQTEYEYRDLIVSRFSNLGELQYIEHIEKDFLTTSRRESGYTLARYNNETYIIFNDFKSNAERKEIGKKGRVYTDIAVLDSAGRLKHHSNLFTNRDSKLAFSTRVTGFDHDNILLSRISGNAIEVGLIDFAK